MSTMSTQLSFPTLPFAVHTAKPWHDADGLSMVYTDGVHLVATNVAVLHAFAEAMQLPRAYFHGIRKGHPHYDLTSVNRRIDAYALGARKVDARWIVEQFRNGTLKTK